MEQVRSNPTMNSTITLTTYTISSTGASGTVNVSTDCSAMERGKSVLLNFTGGSAGGFVSNEEYWVIPVASGSFRVASTKANALNGTYVSGASGNAGAGTVYPNYRVGGVIFVGTTGNLNLRGYANETTGVSSFSLHKNIPDSSFLPVMVREVSASGTTASDICCWYDS